MPFVAFRIFSKSGNPGLRSPFKIRVIVEAGTPTSSAKCDGFLLFDVRYSDSVMMANDLPYGFYSVKPYGKEN